MTTVRFGGRSRSRAGSRDVLNLAGPVLEDQVAALEAAAARCADLDTGRVAIRGWSFGGFLAALAVLRRPERTCSHLQVDFLREVIDPKDR